jgi:multiple sugar transport system substrate-binding protein
MFRICHFGTTGKGEAMKRCAVLFLSAILFAGILIPANAGGSRAAPVDLNAPAELTLWTHEDPNRGPMEREFIEQFTAKNPNIKVNYQPQANIYDVLTIAFSANQGPDLFNIGASNMRTFIVEGRVMPIDPTWIGFKNVKEIKDKYMPGPLDMMELDGQLYGLPFEYSLGGGLIYLNKNIFRSAGLDPERDYPKTWEDVVTVSEKIVKRDGDIITRRGFDFRWSIGVDAILPMAEPLGGALISDDGKKAVIGDEAWIQVLEYFRQWGPHGKNLGGPTYATPRTLFNLDNDEVAMTPSGLYQTARIRAANPSFYDSGNWMVIPQPGWKNQKKAPQVYIDGGQYYAVNSQIPQAKQIWAWRLIDFFLTHGEDYLAKAALLMPTYDLLNSATFKAIPYADVFVKSQETAKPLGYDNVPLMNAAVKSATEAALNGEDPKTILPRFRREIQEILDQN